MEDNSSTTTTTTEINRFTEFTQNQLNDSEQQTVIDLAFDVLKARHRPGQPLTCPQQTRNFLRLLLADRKVEIFGCLYLDTQHRVIDTVELFQGTIDGASVYPRVVAQQALEANAAAILLFHNHPSQVAEPSRADERITQRLQKALELIDIRVLDHFVIGANDTVSFAERGLL
ncbi:DNA repair protein RadC [Pseudomaricurvus alkylphenolicus]|uniref:RadC family protein n=1 Tax=Pseudomaricurvus alkylphenolicus TaxID=1306991 RepID=UPI00142068E2|nr:DNA repair protein RadC [Pseudomaricurvus alkylphenolicus]NIB44067.1 DNA repair protein RadC [Pseudomaricurvus alkylphenolicus]